MNTIKSILVLIVALTFSGPLESQTIEEPDAPELTKLFNERTQQWMEAYNDNDPYRLEQLYANDAQYISSHVNGLVADGREKVIANFKLGMQMGGHIDSIEVLDMNVSCNLATLLCRYQATNNGETVTGRNLLVLENLNGIWLIVLHMTVV